MNMKRLFTFVCLLLVATVTGWAQVAPWTGATGAGTKADPYQITSQADLEAFRDAVNATPSNSFAEKFIKLTTDIALTLPTGTDAPGWEPIGRSDKEFKGTFDGGGHTISGLWINRPTEGDIGLFGSVRGFQCTTNATIKNLSVAIDGTIGVTGNNYVGGLVGYVYDGVITNCGVSGNVTGTWYTVGGLIGSYSNSSGHRTTNQITNCYATGNVSGEYNVGGLVGFTASLAITNCYATGQVTATDTADPVAGGLVGYNSNTFTNCYYNSGALSSGRGVGGGTTDPAGVTGKTLAEMKTADFCSLFNNSGYGIFWGIDPAKNGGFPYLLATPIFFDGSDGTEASPYAINTPEYLAGLANYISDGYETAGKYFKVTADINLTSYLAEGGAGYNAGAGWNPIGSGKSFLGVFDGGGHTISGLWINRPGLGSVGLFGYIDDATIKSLAVSLDAKGVKGNNKVGGLVGYSKNSTITSCAVIGEENAVIQYYYGYSFGGLVGETYEGGIEACYAAVNVEGYNLIGGLVGNNTATITNSYATGAITARGTTGVYFGGLVGYNGASIINSFATGNVTGEGTLLNSGGLVGCSPGTIEKCYATGTVDVIESDPTTPNHTGGLVGNNEYLTYSGRIDASFFLNEGANSTLKVVGAENGTVTNSSGKSAAELKDPGTFTTAPANWKFGEGGIWAIDATGTKGLYINRGYPYLKALENTYAVAPPPFGGGEGTEASPYLISSAETLAVFATFVNDGGDTEDVYFKLTTDINLANYLAVGGAGNNAGAGWMPIGRYDKDFKGTFDGNSHTISGLWINRPTEGRIGLFGYISSSALINDLTVVIDNDNTNATKGITGNNYVAGLVGWNKGEVLNCAVLSNNSGIAITLCQTSGSHAGGLAGFNGGSIISSYARVDMQGPENGAPCLGGLAGSNADGADVIISSCYATGAITARGTRGDFGGLVGNNDASIDNSYATGNVTGEGTQLNSGGLAGYNLGTIEKCYATGTVDVIESEPDEPNHTGGLVGNNKHDAGEGRLFIGRIDASFFLNEGANSTLKVVGAENGTVTNSSGKSAAELKDPDTFTTAPADWKFGEGGIWAIAPYATVNGGYPYLQWQPTHTVTMTVGEGYTYTVGGQAITVTTTIAVAPGGSFDFSYTVLEGYEGTGTVEGDGITEAGGVYTLTADKDGLTVTVTGLTKTEPDPTDPVITYHTLTLTTGTGIVIDKDKSSFQIQSGNPFSFVITLAEGYEGMTPTVTVNDRLKGLISIGTDRWRCILSEVYEDTDVLVSLNLTGNEAVAAPQLYSRDGQLFIDAPTGTTCAIYNVTGQVVVNRRLAPGLTTFPLATGIYIVKLEGLTKRVIVSK